MPNRRFQNQDEHESAFIYVDLLPDVRRPRQFNVNVILIVLIAVFLTWLLIYWPLSGRQNQLDAALDANNDLTTQREFLDQQINTYRIDRDRIDLLENIELAIDHQINVLEYHDALYNAVTSVESEGRIEIINYNVSTNVITMRVHLQRSLSYDNVNIAFLDLPFVEGSSYTLSNREFTLEVAE